MNTLSIFQESLIPGEVFLAFSPVARRYLSGFSSTDGVLLVRCDGADLFLDPRYFEMACLAQKRGAIPGEIRIRPAEFARTFAAYLSDGEKPVYFEDRRVTVAELETLSRRFPKARFLPLGDRLDRMRIAKTEEEIGRIRAAQALADEAFRHILGLISPERTELEIAAELERFMKVSGASGTSFDTICIAGTKTSLPHGAPEDRPIGKDVFLTMDFGCVLDGYCSDMTRTVCVGRASEKMREVYDTVLAAHSAGLSAIRAGVSGSEVDRAARSVIERAGYGENFGHSTGHGIGLEVHEAPSFAPRADAPVPAGAVLSVEPGIYLPGKFGVRIEDLAVVRENGFEGLNTTEKGLIEL